MGEVHIKRDFSMPASIQFKNPGAMWPGDRATKWGSTKWQYLNDHTGQGGNGKGNKIAIFDNWVDGISAQLDLWRTSPNYKNKTLRSALKVWSGGNSPEEYVKHIVRKIPTMSGDTIMNEAFWQSPDGLKFLRVQAEHEAGKPIPATPADYAEAQRRVMKGFIPTANTVKKAATSAGSMLPTVPAVQHAAGLSFSTALLIGLGIAVVIFLLWKFWPRPAHEDLPAIVNPNPPSAEAEAAAGAPAMQPVPPKGAAS